MLLCVWSKDLQAWYVRVDSALPGFRKEGAKVQEKKKKTEVSTTMKMFAQGWCKHWGMNCSFMWKKQTNCVMFGPVEITVIFANISAALSNTILFHGQLSRKNGDISHWHTVRPDFQNTFVHVNIKLGKDKGLTFIMLTATSTVAIKKKWSAGSRQNMYLVYHFCVAFIPFLDWKYTYLFFCSDVLMGYVSCAVFFKIQCFNKLNKNI